MSFPVFFDTCVLYGEIVNEYPQTPEDYAHMLQRSGLPQFARQIYPTLTALDEQD